MEISRSPDLRGAIIALAAIAVGVMSTLVTASPRAHGAGVDNVAAESPLTTRPEVLPLALVVGSDDGAMDDLSRAGHVTLLRADPLPPEPLGGIDVSKSPRGDGSSSSFIDIVASGNLVLAASGTAGWDVFEIVPGNQLELRFENNAGPLVNGRVSSAMSVAVQENPSGDGLVAYVGWSKYKESGPDSSAEGGLDVFRVTARAVTRVKRIENLGVVNALWSQGDRLVAATSSCGGFTGWCNSELLVFDVSSPESPRQVGAGPVVKEDFMDRQGPRDVVIAGTFALVADGNDVHLVAVGNLDGDPVPFITRETPGEAMAVAAVDEGRFYIADGSNGFISGSIGGLLAQDWCGFEAAPLGTPGSAPDLLGPAVAVVTDDLRNRAFVATERGGIQVYDVSGTTPSWLDSVAVAGQSHSVGVFPFVEIPDDSCPFTSPSIDVLGGPPIANHAFQVHIQAVSPDTCVPKSGTARLDGDLVFIDSAYACGFCSPAVTSVDFTVQVPPLAAGTYTLIWFPECATLASSEGCASLEITVEPEVTTEVDVYLRAGVGGPRLADGVSVKPGDPIQACAYVTGRSFVDVSVCAPDHTCMNSNGTVTDTLCHSETKASAVLGRHDVTAEAMDPNTRALWDTDSTYYTVVRDTVPPPNCTGLRGQVTSVSSSGPVKDVELTFRAGGGSGREYKSKSDGQGRYQLPDLGAGTYDIRFEKYNNLFVPLADQVVVRANVCNEYDVVLKPKDRVAILVHGYGGFSKLDPGHSSTEGITSFNPDRPDFGKMGRLLADNGHAVFAAHYNTNHVHTDALVDSGKVLGRQIQEALDVANAVRAPGGAITRVSLYAHSMGGLVSRAYLEARANKDNPKVDRLYTFGTPHRGIADGIMNLLGSILVGECQWRPGGGCKVDCARDPGTCQLTESFVTKTFKERNQRVGHFAFGGDRGHFITNAVYGLSPNDTVIALSSSLGINSGRYRVDDAHVTVTIGPTKLVGYMDGEKSLSCIKNLTGIDRSATCEPFAGVLSRGGNPSGRAMLDQADANTERTVLLQRHGLRALGTNDFSVPLDGGDATALVRWRGGTTVVVLQTPDGKSIHQDEIEVRLPGAHVENALLDDGGALEIRLPRAASGVWKLLVTEVSGQPSQVVALVTLVSPVALRVEMPGSLPTGSQAIVGAVLVSGGKVLRGGKIEVAVEDQAPVTLNEGPDGHHAGRIVVPDRAGVVQMSFHATGRTIDGTPVERFENVFRPLRLPHVAMTGPSALTRVDSDGNGLFDKVHMVVPLRTDLPGNYRVDAVLRDPAGQEVATFSLEDTWPSGPSELMLDFDGQLIGRRALDGTFSVDLAIVNVDTLDVTIDEAPLFTTQWWSAADFVGGPPQRRHVYLPWVVGTAQLRDDCLSAETEPNDSPVLAVAVAGLCSSTAIHGALRSVDDTDVYRLEISRNSVVNATLWNIAGSERYRLALLNSSYEELAVSLDEPSVGLRRLVQRVPAGRYFLVVRAQYDTGARPYNLVWEEQ